MIRAPRCPFMTEGVFNATPKQCARWEGHSGPCYPYLSVIATMAQKIRDEQDYDEDVAIEQFIEEAQDAWDRRVS